MDRTFASSTSSGSAIDNLIFDSFINDTTEMDIEANLDLWANTQFKYDTDTVMPDSAKPSPTTTAVSILNPLSAAASLFDGSPGEIDAKITYDDIATYLYFEPPEQQQQQQQQLTQTIASQQQQQQQQPTIKAAPRQQLLLPKIDENTTMEDVTKLLLLSSNNNSTLSTASSLLVPRTSTVTTQKQKHVAYTTPSSNKPSKTAAEEEKRRRNTAASARFRVKKKLKEKVMEQTVREMTEKSTKLEGRVRELELEIKFLRALLIEKNRSAQSSSSVSDEEPVSAK